MEVDPAEIDVVLALLAQTPLRIDAASKGLENARLCFKPDKETWSANDILAHLRSCADVWGGSILKMITEDHPTQRYISPRTWIRKTDYPDQKFSPSLEIFTRKRAELLDTLKALSIADWSRSAIVIVSNGERTQTVFSYARQLASHENEHCQQIEALLK